VSTNSHLLYYFLPLKVKLKLAQNARKTASLVNTFLPWGFM